ncbi:MAG: hypothetical protein IPO07_12280 [Haliscomenobacter sp.]|nr:hypothetical protein [Haliscomenobacter sp.]MBK9489471.1 hypothetical protein [Haliscomenobacter sp.]
MPRLICTFFYLLPFTISAQEISDTLLFRDPANYTIAVEHYLQKIKTGNPAFNNFYQAACYYALLKKQDMAFSYLKEAIKRGAKGEDVLTDTDLAILKQDLNSWREIDALLKNNIWNAIRAFQN